MDENVHFAGTAELIDALSRWQPFDLVLFPRERHGYRSPVARRMPGSGCWSIRPRTFELDRPC